MGGTGGREDVSGWEDARTLVHLHAEYGASLAEAGGPSAGAIDWDAAQSLSAAHDAFVASCHVPLAEILEESERRLFEGQLPDPLRASWRRFRPLRLSLEEDWADWLAHLIETHPDPSLTRRLRQRAWGQIRLMQIPSNR